MFTMSYSQIQFLGGGVPGADPMREIHVRLAKVVKLQSIGISECVSSEKCMKEIQQRDRLQEIPATTGGEVAGNEEKCARTKFTQNTLFDESRAA